MSRPTTATERHDRIHLIVLYGGQSAEHDVSCTTAAHVLRAIDPTRYRVTPVGISRAGVWHVDAALAEAHRSDPGALPGRLDPSGETVSATPMLTAARTASDALVAGGEPVAVLPLLHGPMGEDGTVQGLLELADVAYVGSGVLGSAVGMDKAMAKQVLAAAGIPQARAHSMRDCEVTPATAEALAAELGLPVFVKPANMGSSVGVSKARTVDEIRIALALAFSYDEWVVVEEAIAGREIEVAVLGNETPRASVPGEIVPGAEFYSYDDKYVDDGAKLLIPAPLSASEADDVRALAVDVFRALRCDGLARVDFFYEEAGRGWLCNEVNTMPGFTPISMYPKLWQESGLGYGELIDELVALALRRHARRRRNTSH